MVYPCNHRASGPHSRIL